MKKEREIKQEVWQEKYEAIVREIAQIEVDLAISKLLPPDEKVGDREVGKYAGRASTVPVTAKEIVSNAEKALERLTMRKITLERLMQQ